MFTELSAVILPMLNMGQATASYDNHHSHVIRLHNVPFLILTQIPKRHWPSRIKNEYLYLKAHLLKTSSYNDSFTIGARRPQFQFKLFRNVSLPKKNNPGLIFQLKHLLKVLNIGQSWNSLKFTFGVLAAWRTSSFKIWQNTKTLSKSENRRLSQRTTCIHLDYIVIL